MTVDKPSEASLDQAAEILRVSRKVTVLTGAGVSAESGVPTFRASDGLWEGHRIEAVATPTGFAKDPSLVWQFYNARRANVARVRPNPAHLALAKLEQLKVNGLTLITQNVDGLHTLAGSQRVLEIHGSLYRTRCVECGEIKNQGLIELGPLPRCTSCEGPLRPDIVWFHESLPEQIWETAQQAAYECEVLLVIGTSAVVYPAANLVPIAKGNQGLKPIPAKVIEFNLSRTEASPLADIGIYGPAGETLPRLIERISD